MEWTSLERMETAIGDEKKDVLYSWTYSPSGRYAVDFDYKEIAQLEDEPETHHFLFRFFVLDILEKTWYHYIVNTGPFKRFYSFYWLSDCDGVLLDFSKREGSVRQNFLYFDHGEKIVSCNIIRNVTFDVDYMCYSKDFTAQKIIVPEGEFLLLCGYRSSHEGIVCRLVPYYPFERTISPMREFFIDTRRIILYLTGDVRLHTGGHPFVFGSTMTFLLYRDNPMSMLHYINYTLQIDLGSALQEEQRYITPRHARMKMFILPQNPEWIPCFNSIPNLFNTEKYVLLWEEPKRNYSRRRKGKTRVFLLDLKTSKMHVIHTSLLKKDFICIHPSGAVHTFVQTASGMKMKANNMCFETHSLEKLCQQELIRTTSKATPTLLELSTLAFLRNLDSYC